MLTAAIDTALGCGAAAHFSQLYLELQRSIASASMRPTVGISSLVSPSYLASHVVCRVARSLRQLLVFPPTLPCIPRPCLRALDE